MVQAIFVARLSTFALEIADHFTLEAARRDLATIVPGARASPCRDRGWSGETVPPARPRPCSRRVCREKTAWL